MTSERQTQQVPFKPFAEVISGFSKEGSSKVSGLDFGPTLDWYKENKGFLREILKSKLGGSKKANLPAITNPESLSLSLDTISMLIGLFPQEAQEKSKAVKISGEGSLWFIKDSAAGELPITKDKSKALSETAVIPAFTGYKRISNENNLIAEIELYKMPDGLEVDSEMAELIAAEGLVHEYVHSILTDLTFFDKTLKLPNGRIVKAKDLITEFKNIVEAKTPISHYASNSRDENNEFGKDPDGDKTQAVSEEFAETVTLYLLGYASGNLTDITKDALEDRVEVKKLIDDFLKSEVVKTEETSVVKTSS